MATPTPLILSRFALVRCREILAQHVAMALAQHKDETPL
jgi:hypothetical protein